MTNVIDRIGELLTNLQSPDFYEREEAVRELGRFSEDEAVAGLVMAIEDSDLGIRELAGEQLVAIKGPIAAQLLVQFLGHDDIATRNLSAEILVRFGKDAISALIDSIAVDDYDVRKFIVDLLGLIKDGSAVEAVGERLWDDNINVVCSAAESLGLIGSNKAVPALLAAAEKIEDARLPAIEALGKIGDLSVLNRLYEYASSNDAMVQFAAMEAIGKIGQSESLDHLQVYLNNDDSCIAETALVASINIIHHNDLTMKVDLPLDRFTEFLFQGVASGDQKLTDFVLTRPADWYRGDIIKSMIAAVESVSEDVVKRITEILVGAGNEGHRFILEGMVSATPDGKVKLLDLVKGNITEEITQCLTPFADDDDPEVRRKVAYLLGVSGSLAVLPELEKLSSDSVGHVRSAAYGALGWLSDESVITRLSAGLDDPFPDVREAAAGALILLGTEEVVKLFTDSLDHDDVERQRLAIMALGKIGDATVVEPLLRSIQHAEPTIRKSAIDSLARIGSTDDLDPIVFALNDEDTGVRKSAVSAIIALRGENAIQDIRFLLEDDDVWVRYFVINAIGELGYKEHAEFIKPYLKTDQDIIKIATIKALSRLGCRADVAEWSKTGEETNLDVVSAVEEAISGGNG